MKKLLVIVDYQYDFVEGSLGFAEAKYLEQGIYERILEYKKNHQEVIFTLDTHFDNYLETQEGKSLPIPHCLLGSKGHELFGRVKDLEDLASKTFIKYTFSSLEFGIHLKDQDYDEIEFCGLVSNICVLSNAIMARAALPNAKITIDASLTASYDSSLHEKALDIMEGLLFEVRNRKIV